MRFDRPLLAFLLLLGLVGCSGKNAENTAVGAASDVAGDVAGDANSNQSTQDQVDSNIAAASGDSGAVQPAAEPANLIKGWGTKEDPAGGTTIELQDTTLVMTTPDIYVDNYPPGKVNAPRVLQEVSGDFAVEVKVTHLDPSQTNSVLKSLGSFPTAYHERQPYQSTATAGNKLPYRKPRLKDISDGLSSTILIGERAGRPDLYRKGKPVDPYPYSNPTMVGMDHHQAAWGISTHFWWLVFLRTQSINGTNATGIYSFHTSGAHVGLADGSVRFLSESMNQETLNAMATRSEGEVVTLE